MSLKVLAQHSVSVGLFFKEILSSRVRFLHRIVAEYVDKGIVLCVCFCVFSVCYNMNCVCVCVCGWGGFLIRYEIRQKEALCWMRYNSNVSDNVYLCVYLSLHLSLSHHLIWMTESSLCVCLCAASVCSVYDGDNRDSWFQTHSDFDSLLSSWSLKRCQLPRTLFPR